MDRRNQAGPDMWQEKAEQVAAGMQAENNSEEGRSCTVGYHG